MFFLLCNSYAYEYHHHEIRLQFEIAISSTPKKIIEHNIFIHELKLRFIAMRGDEDKKSKNKNLLAEGINY